MTPPREPDRYDKLDLNLNDSVWVRVTAFGEQIYRQHWTALRMDPIPLRRDADGWTMFQLWEMAYIFGAAMYNGSQVPVETTIRVRALVSPAAAPAAETEQAGEAGGAAAPCNPSSARSPATATGVEQRHPSGPVAPAPSAHLQSTEIACAPDPFAGHSDAEVQAALDEVRGKPVAAADPCQRCGRLGGHGVEFRFDGISMSSWICPHCLDAQEKRIAELETILRECEEALTGALGWADEDSADGQRVTAILAKLAARAATPSTPDDGSAET